MTDLTDSFKLLPEGIQKRILCVDKDQWVNTEVFNPDGSKTRFCDLTQHRRNVIYHALLKSGLAEPPDPARYWIWFGGFAGKCKTAQLGGKPVRRILFKHFRFDPGPDRRIVDPMSAHREDVNPFNTNASHGQRFLTVNAPTTIKPFSEEALIPEVAKLVAHLREEWSPSDTDDNLRLYLQSDWPPPVIERALPIWRKESTP